MNHPERKERPKHDDLIIDQKVHSNIDQPQPEKSPKSQRSLRNLKELKAAENIIQKQRLEKSQHSEPESLKYREEAAGKEGLQGIDTEQGKESGKLYEDDVMLLDQGVPATLDPTLQLLDCQLRHILKPSREDLLLSPQGDGSRKTKDGQDSGSVEVWERGRKGEEDEGMYAQDPNLLCRNDVDEPRLLQDGLFTDHALGGSVDVRRTELQNQAPVGFGGHYNSQDIHVHMERLGHEGDMDECDADDEEILVVEIKQANVYSEKDEECSEDKEGSPDARRGSTRTGGVKFGGIEFEEISQGNLYKDEDAPTNVYMDDVATRAAPYTVVSQFNVSLASSEEEDDTDNDDHRGHQSHGLPRPLSLTSLTQSPFSERRRGSQQSKLLQDGDDKSGSSHREICRRDSEKGFGKENVPEFMLCKKVGEDCVPGLPRSISAGQVISDHSSVVDYPSVPQHKSLKVIMNEIPRPIFSTRSPSSPAKLVNSPYLSSPVKIKPLGLLPTSAITVPPDLSALSVKLDIQSPDPTTENGEKPTTPVAEPPPVEPLADEDASSGSDTEIQQYKLDQNKVQQKLLELKLEDRGEADGQSPRDLFPVEQCNGGEDSLSQNGEATTPLPDGPENITVGLGTIGLGTLDFSARLDTLMAEGSPRGLVGIQKAVLEPQDVFRTKSTRIDELQLNDDVESRGSGSEHLSVHSKLVNADKASPQSESPVLDRPSAKPPRTPVKLVAHNSPISLPAYLSSPTHSPSKLHSPRQLSSLLPRPATFSALTDVCHSDWDSSSRSTTESSRSGGERGTGPRRTSTGGAVPKLGHNVRQHLHSQSAGPRMEENEEVDLTGRATVDIGMLDDRPPSSELTPVPKPPPGQASRKALLSNRAR